MLKLQGKSPPDSESSDESSDESPCASASYSASCVSAECIKDEDGLSGSRSPSAMDNSLITKLRGKSPSDSDSSSESSEKTPCASASCSASCVSAECIKDEDGLSGSRSPSAMDNTLTH